MQNYRNGKWAIRIISMQHPDGGWGCFHTLHGDRDTPMTTEMALLRLELLGYTAEDECIKGAIAHMETLLHTGKLPEGKEKTNAFETFVDLVVATRIRRFTDVANLTMRSPGNGRRYWPQRSVAVHILKVIMKRAICRCSEESSRAED